MLFRDVLDVASVLILEVYRELGTKFEDAADDLEDRLRDDAEPDQVKVPTPREEAASMALLMSMMGGSDFQGPKG